VALGFSESSKEKIKERGIENALLIEEIKSNQKAEGIRILGVKE
jgi:ribosomal protein L18E